MTSNWLYIVGCGFSGRGQFTIQTINIIRSADIVLHVVGDKLAEEYIVELNANAQTLRDLYAEGKPRLDTYFEMVSAIASQLKAGKNVCGLFYGHPGVFAFPSHESVRWARANGYDAQMLPGISAEDCLFADLGIDPATAGCQSYEASDFLISDRIIDTSAALILWQVGVIGHTDFQPKDYIDKGQQLLVDRLMRDYPLDHETIIYEAATLPMQQPRIERATIKQLAERKLSAISTLYVGPSRPKTRNEEVIRALGITAEDLAVNLDQRRAAIDPS